MSTVDRRRFLGLSGLAVVGGIASVGIGTGFSFGRVLNGSGEPGVLVRSGAHLPPAFRRPLPIPPVLRPTRSDTATDYYEITQRAADVEYLPGLRTPSWTYNGSFPGPTLITRSGRRAVVTHRNELPRPVVVHLHGGHMPADSDGYPGDTILPGDGSSVSHDMSVPGNPVVGSRDYVYPGKQRAATLWYHDHSMGFTGATVYRGLAGFHLVRDDEDDALPLPKGDRDIPLMITDRSFAADGQFAYPSLAPNLTVPGVTDDHLNGVLGDVVLVNGAPWPALPVDRQRYRFRILNASNCRRYGLRLDPPPPDGDPTFTQIGSDGGLLSRPLTHESIDVAPAERFDVVLDFARYAPGTRVRLVNTLATDRTGEVMCFDVSDRTPQDTTAIPDELSSVEYLDPRQAVRTREFLFQSQNGDPGWSINGEPYTPGTVLAHSRLGDLELWRFTSDVHHPVHVHLNHFQVTRRSNGGPGPYDAGWKDTVDLLPAQAMEVAIRFTDYPGRFVFHCHNLEHEDMGMMADFTTI
ncbi:multicopper oxidase family protein [Actinokineospora spheciospongiae]|uniref:multicopper oxidase family protein n=1 Tax=Actinokineospora spheciospongiae TaxID=909613 RepID=UPI000D71B961|nr:multicopper oxidase domain-containing protein [Actinokineospora spheciospongiae]PWW64433.1 FtsP/CotA-like multicopper oxidase with cupredoxin domain [Actinokineospora spheciospongiae]